MATARRVDEHRVEVVLDPHETMILDFFTLEHQTTLEAMLAKMVSHWAAENLSLVRRTLHQRALVEVRTAGVLGPTLRDTLDALDRLGISEDHGHLVEKAPEEPQ